MNHNMPASSYTVSMLVIATAQDKAIIVAEQLLGTLKANAEKTYLIGSQRELVSSIW